MTLKIIKVIIILNLHLCVILIDTYIEALINFSFLDKGVTTASIKYPRINKLLLSMDIVFR